MSSGSSSYSYDSSSSSIEQMLSDICTEYIPPGVVDPTIMPLSGQGASQLPEQVGGLNGQYPQGPNFEPLIGPALGDSSFAVSQ